VRGLRPGPDTLADIQARAAPAFERRLRKGSAAPIAVAFSGGGDSLALLLIAADWAKAAGRPLVVLHVDHALQPQSARWAARCEAVAARLGLPFRKLTWTGEKPARGLPAAARRARHGLIAEAAREAGAAVVLVGHTADDLAETVAMRAEGSTTPLAREWGPSPVWPQGRGVFLLRPLLTIDRAGIRDWLTARGEAWIDDPANLDPRFARARARAAGAPAAPAPAEADAAAELARAVRLEPGDVMALDRSLLRVAAPEAVLALVSAASLCAGGGERPPRRARAWALAERLQGGEEVVATLAGARIEADAEAVRFLREAGEAVRGGLAETRVLPGVPAVWDGRYEVAADRPVVVRRLAGAARRLPAPQQSALLAVRASARGALPLIVDEGACSLADAVAGVWARYLGLDRLLAACGAVPREP